jgi:ABC-type anion transport system duplicated permease subunit
MHKKYIFIIIGILIVIILFFSLRKKEDNVIVEEPVQPANEEQDPETKSDSDQSVDQVIQGVSNAPKKEMSDLAKKYNEIVASNEIPKEEKKDKLKNIESKLQDLSKNINLDDIKNNKQVTGILNKIGIKL